MEMYIVCIALFMDKMIGDPRSRWHPVVLIGNLISLLEKKLRNPQHAVVRQRMAGALLVVLVLLIAYGLVNLLCRYFYSTDYFVGIAIEAVLLSFAITPRSLAEAGGEIRDYLLSGNMAEARRKVGWIVGRDTANLDTAGITRATVETVAENIVDGIIAPLFYFAIGGAPLAFLYRAVNTMDSMIGYKNDKYLHFGMPAARLDDVFNYIPARVTGVLLVAAAWILRYDAAGAAGAIKRDAAKHPSPNSGIAEAGTAGALGIRLGGLNYYGGVASFRAYMGEERQTMQPGHITQTISLMITVTVLFATIITVLKAVYR